MGDIKFAFEDLEVWRKAAESANVVINALESLDTKQDTFQVNRAGRSSCNLYGDEYC